MKREVPDCLPEIQQAILPEYVDFVNRIVDEMAEIDDKLVGVELAQAVASEYKAARKRLLNVLYPGVKDGLAKECRRCLLRAMEKVDGSTGWRSTDQTYGPTPGDMRTERGTRAIAACLALPARRNAAVAAMYKADIHGKFVRASVRDTKSDGLASRAMRGHVDKSCMLPLDVDHNTQDFFVLPPIYI